MKTRNIAIPAKKKSGRTMVNAWSAPLSASEPIGTVKPSSYKAYGILVNSETIVRRL